MHKIDMFEFIMEYLCRHCKRSCYKDDTWKNGACIWYPINNVMFVFPRRIG